MAQRDSGGRRGKGPTLLDPAAVEIDFGGDGIDPDGLGSLDGLLAPGSLGDASLHPDDGDVDPLLAEARAFAATSPQAGAPGMQPAAPPVGRLLYTGPSPHSGHRIDTFIRCPQLYAFKYVLEVLDTSSADPDPFEDRLGILRGTLGHQAHGLHYSRLRAHQRGEDPDEFAQPEEGVRRMATERGPAWEDHAEGVIQGHRDYLRFHHGERVEVVAVEHVFDLSPIMGFPHTRSVDLVTTDASRLIYFWDHKWTFRKQDATVDGYRIDGQFIDYGIILEAKYGSRSDPTSRNGGAWLNLGEWGDRGGSMRYRFLRQEIPTTARSRQKRIQRVRQANRELLDLQARGVDPWEWPAAQTEQVCRGPYGACEAIDLCLWGRAATRSKEGADGGPGSSRLRVLP